MARNFTADDRTLFHLIPARGSQPAEEAFSHPDNRRFVSLSAANKLGLEIGFHVPSFSRGHVITRLGRNTDVILRESYSAVHVAFEIHPETLIMVDKAQTVEKTQTAEKAQTVDTQSPGIRPTEGPVRVQSLKDLATKGYEDAMQRLKDVRSRDLSIPESSTTNSWYMARLQSAKASLFTEFKGCRVLIGEGGFGKLYKTVDRESGNYFAAKEVDLKGRAGVDREAARTALHREIKIMETVSHGSLHSLVQGGKASHPLRSRVLDQMLRALDYLAFRNYCHRDVKPLNILYHTLGQHNYHFQLANFGLANDFRNAKTFCGTTLYLAPELYDGQSQTPKMDIYSLFVTMAEILPDYAFPPKTVTGPSDIIQAVQKAAAAGYPQLQPMARMNPKLRASAAQMLLALFAGKSLTTPKNQIPRIEPDAPQPAAMPLSAQAARRPAALPVIEYPRRRGQQPPWPVASPGILPNRLPQRPLVQQPIRAQRDGIRKQPAPQAGPRGRLLHAMQVMQAQTEGIQPRAVNKPAQETEPLAMPPKHPEKIQLPAPREAGPARNVPVPAEVANPSESTAPHLPGTFPNSRRC
ncbi:kinase-like domain-containing protein [Achaetomium macrosporum]|uniref:mitogen-activated protein kinase kinase n=1 Tax=Achaetomium macrosporum TaxID=79813 RepID=A0AAN7CAG8_9PEZI|nr:kinase-like domain-containing protein [Achaetomium macrosporum]